MPTDVGDASTTRTVGDKRVYPERLSSGRTVLPWTVVGAESGCSGSPGIAGMTRTPRSQRPQLSTGARFWQNWPKWCTK